MLNEEPKTEQVQGYDALCTIRKTERSKNIGDKLLKEGSVQQCRQIYLSVLNYGGW
eukprot:XP_001706935.1 Hypothetical protein GL50803_114858 [Giardia lamblia ATCC 50803]